MNICEGIAVLELRASSPAGSPDDIQNELREAIEAYLGKKKEAHDGADLKSADDIWRTTAASTLPGAFLLRSTRARSLTLIGANGAGKSTILNTDSGLLHPGGSVLFEDYDSWRRSRIRSLHGLAQVRGTSHLPADDRGGEFAVMGAYTQPNSTIEPGIADVYERFPRLKERRRQIAGTLSGGEQQMLAMGRAPGECFSKLPSARRAVHGPRAHSGRADSEHHPRAARRGHDHPARSRNAQAAPRAGIAPMCSRLAKISPNF